MRKKYVTAFRLSGLVLSTGGIFWSSFLLAEEAGSFELSAYTAQAHLQANKTLKRLKNLPEPGEKDYSARGDAWFFLGKYKAAIADYNAMCKLNPDLEDSHWRRGIAWYYAGDFQKAARQFERYHTYDNVDRENGIWRFFSQVRARNQEYARQELLRYQKDDREPFPLLYQLFAGKNEPARILEQIKRRKLTTREREKQSFYADLYIGLYYAVEGKNEKAVPHLRRAVQNEWAPRAGYGPHYMWQVGRLQLERLLKKSTPKTPSR